ncbi:MAG TPA: nucleoside hydrolase-like domain-containing protein [Cyclobacteriaceae bacterium]
MKFRMLYLLIVLLQIATPGVGQSQSLKPRTVVTTDGEVDDQDSFIRMLLYANEFNLIGLVYSSSQWHYTGDGKGTKFVSEIPMTKKLYGERTELRWPGTDWMQEFIDKYATVYPNLSKHANGYPSPDYLKSLVKVGNIEFEGEMEKNTAGSEFIKGLLLDDSKEPIYMQIWGGTNTVARALKSIEVEFKNSSQWSTIKKKVSDKAIIYAVLDQDATYQKYVAPNWPDIKVFYNAAQFWNFAYPWPRVVPAQLQPYLRGEWFKENIKFNHGPLLSSYYLWGDGTRIKNDFDHTHGDTTTLKKNNMTRYDFISEGDSPAFFHLIDVGLDNLSDASYGGWGGRMVQSKTNNLRWEDGDSVTDYNPFTQKSDKAYPQTRWIDVLQNDFAARADWCVLPFDKANHAPVVKLNHPKSIKAKPGAVVKLSGRANDPDGNVVNYKWWQYFEVDTYEGKVEITDKEKSKASFIIPADAKKGDTIHVILEVNDSGGPKLTRYQRLIVTVI